MSRVLLLDYGDEIVVQALGDGPASVGFLASPGVALHRVPLFESRVRAMFAEARARAADLTAGDPAALFVALGRRDADGAAWAAFADPDVVRRALAAAAAAGHDLRALVPAPLALPVAGEAARAAHGALAWTRDAAVAAVMEAELADVVLGEAAVTAVDPVEAVLEAAEPFALDLRQGMFRRRVRWWRDRRWQRRIGGLAGLALLLAAAGPAVEAWRDSVAIERADAATLAAARRAGVVVGPGTSAVAAGEALAARRDRSDPLAVPGRIASMAQAVAQSGGARLTLLAVASDGSVIGAMAGPPAAMTRVHAVLGLRGLAPDRAGTGVTLRRVPATALETPRATAEARAVRAEADAAAVAAAGRRLAPEPLFAARAALAAAQLEPPAATAAADVGGASVTARAALAPVALGLIADVAGQGLVLDSATVSPNPDATVRATLRWRRP